MEGRSSSGAGKKLEENDNIEPFRPRKNFYDPRDLRSWAKRTGFVSTFSGETDRGSVSGRNQNEREKFDLEKGLQKDSLSPTIEIDPILGRTRNRGLETEGSGNGPSRNDREGGFQLRDEILRDENQSNRDGIVAKTEDKKDSLNRNAIGTATGNGNVGVGGNGHGVQMVASETEERKEDEDLDGEVGVPAFPEGEGPSYGGWHQSPKMKCGLRDNPGFG